MSADPRLNHRPATGRACALTFGSLFAGIGGIDLGLESVGMECRWQVEIDDFCNRALERHWPGVPRFRDARDCGAHNLSAVDLVCGGFPCQDVSLAGQRLGLEGQRSTLWSEFARIICEIRPRWVLAENVPGLLSSDNGRFFGEVLRDLAACGYDAEWDCIPASAVGAPHTRDRAFIVAHAQGYGINHDCPRSVFATCEQNTLAWMGRGRSIVGCRSHKAQDMAWNGSTWGSNGKPHAESPMVGVADGLPANVDRLRALGNAVVPQVVAELGRLILAADEAR